MEEKKMAYNTDTEAQLTALLITLISVMNIGFLLVLLVAFVL